MIQSKIAGVGKYVPERIVTNDELSQIMDTSDAWIQERTGIKERHYAKRYEESSTTMAHEAAKIAIERAGITSKDIDFIVFATMTPDYYFPGCGVLLQRMFNMDEIPAVDLRNQCSGFIYAISIADQFIRTGMYKNVLVVGAEVHSFGLDFSNSGRNITVIFGDAAGAVVLQPAEKPGQGILSTHLHSDGKNAEILSMLNPGFHCGVWLPEDQKPKKTDKPYADVFINEEQIAKHDFYPQMDGQAVFKKAVEKFPEVIMEALNKNNLQTSDLTVLVPHQANLRICQFVQHKMKLRDDQIFVNIQKYGNTTAASIPLALCEAWEEGRIKEGDLVCLASFGSGFTWGSALIRW